MMDTLEALQLGGQENKGEYGNKAKPGGLEYLASSPLASSTQFASWERQALIKRIVELTAEVSSQVSRNSNNTTNYVVKLICSMMFRAPIQH
jgi:hypothetical protein